MELHIAIKNLVKYKNADFINEPQFINALVDFNAFENYPALKNITRILLSDGYGKKIQNQNSWTMQCQSYISDIARDYSFDISLVEYLLRSIAYGVGFLNSVQAPIQNGSSQQNSASQQSQQSYSNSRSMSLNLTPSQLDKLNDDKRYDYKAAAEQYLDSIVEIKGNWEKELGAKCNVYSHFDSDDGRIRFCFEVDGKVKQDYLEFDSITYNGAGKMISKKIGNTLGARKKAFQVIQTDPLDPDEYRCVSNISKVIVFWSE